MGSKKEGVAAPRRAVGLTLIASLAGLILLLAIAAVVLFVRSGRSRGGEEADTSEVANRGAADELGTNDRGGARSRDYPSVTESSTQASSRPNAGKEGTQLILKDIRARIASRAGMRQPLETQVNNITDYLRGMLAAIRAIDPSIIGTLRDQYENDLCGSNPSGDLDVLVYTRLVILQPHVASPRALNCALDRHKTEDIVMWSLLDAWNASGRAPLAALSSIEGRASDERTTRRLMALEHTSILKEGARPPGMRGRDATGAGRPIPDPMTTRSQQQQESPR